MLGDATFDPRLPRSQLYEQLWTFLEIEIGGVARANLLPPGGDYGGVSVAEAYEVVDQIARHNTLVTVRPSLPGTSGCTIHSTSGLSWWCNNDGVRSDDDAKRLEGGDDDGR